MSATKVNNNKYEIKRKIKNPKRKRGHHNGDLSCTTAMENPELIDSCHNLYKQMEHRSVGTLSPKVKLNKILNQTELIPRGIKSNESYIHEIKQPTKRKKESKKYFGDIGLVNPALDIHFSKPTLKTIDKNFEVIRKPLKNKKNPKDKTCFENPALELQTSAIAVSFKPCLGMRIDFNGDVKNTAEKDEILKQTNILPISGKDIIDVNVNHNEFIYNTNIIKRSDPTDIDKDIDGYQNELENSINEAKMIKNMDECANCMTTRNYSSKTMRNVKNGGIKTCLRKRAKILFMDIINETQLSRR